MIASVLPDDIHMAIKSKYAVLENLFYSSCMFFASQIIVTHHYLMFKLYYKNVLCFSKLLSENGLVLVLAGLVIKQKNEIQESGGG